jgi:hypothetical protein
LSQVVLQEDAKQIKDKVGTWKEVWEGVLERAQNDRWNRSRTEFLELALQQARIEIGPQEALELTLERTLRRADAIESVWRDRFHRVKMSAEL